MEGVRERTIATVARGVAGQLYVDTNHDPRNTIFVAGSGRSGTTWLAEIINRQNEYRYIFEPFHPHKVSVAQTFRPRQYLRPDERDPRFVEPATRILSGRVRSLWTDKFNRKRIAAKRMIKEIRGNLLLGWIHGNFPEVPLILMLRHPCAVVHSQLGREWNWRVDLADLFLQEPLIEDHLAPFEGIFDRATSRFERQVLLWCIENYVPTRQFRRGQIHVMFYEHLYLEPASELERLFSFLGSDFDESVLSGVGKPSALSRTESAIVSGGNVLDRWRDHVAEELVRKAIDLLGPFGLDRLYSEGPVPLVDHGSDALVPGLTPRRPPAP